jgi:hypothetical protein
MYLSSDQVSISFKRLSSRKQEGKTHLERTSVIMYFLAFDAACKAKGNSPLDFDPERNEGKVNRKLIELEFTKLVLLNRVQGKVIQVSELGKIDRIGKDPEKRISSNFLTVPLKTASEHAAPFFYPKRPATPLMGLGESATGLKWGIDYYNEWHNNLPKLLSDIKQSSPFTDLAVFIFRDTFLEDDNNDYVTVLSEALKNRFTEGLCRFWSERIEKEKMFVRHMQAPFSNVHEPFGRNGDTKEGAHHESFNKVELVNHINYLESLLFDHQIQFKPL